VNYDVWQRKLEAISQQGLMRSRAALSGPQGKHVVSNGRTYLNFASNDYLGLANDPRLLNVAKNALDRFGFGSGASDVVCGHFDAHDALECELAEFTRRDKALLFSTGYMANLAVSSAFCDAKSLLFQDKLNHASLIDGGRLAGARSQRYLHNDLSSLAYHVDRLTHKVDYSNIVISTDGVFSMDGDTANVVGLSQLAANHQALLIVDDAHGLGVIGENGRGTVYDAGLSQDQCHLLVGTFGKAFGGFGAFVAGPAVLIDYLQQVARPHTYTTALPPSNVEVMRESLRLVKGANDLRAKLSDNIAYFTKAMRSTPYVLLPSDTPIQGVVIGDNSDTMALAAFMKQHGVMVGAIRPPTVAPNSSRLRITLSATHTQADIDVLVSLLNQGVSLLKQQGACNG